MSFDFTPIGLGISGLSSLSGLLAGSRAQREAQERRDSIIRQMKENNAREYMDVMTGNARSLAARTGELNSGLESTGRSLGAANAAAGVTNSSAVGGSLALGAQGIQKALADYALRNRQLEAGVKARGDQSVLGAELGGADQDLGYARDQEAGGVAGFGQFLQGLGSLGKPAGSPSIMSVPGSGAGSIMSPPPMYDEAGSGQAPPSGYSDTTLGGGMNALPRLSPITLSGTANPLQSYLQGMTQKNRKKMGGFDSRTGGPMMNGMQGSALPSLSYQ